MSTLLRTFSFLCAAFAISLACPARSADVHVSPAGNDAATGAADAPVVSLRRALDRVREIRAAEPGRATPVVVEVADGRHELAATLVIMPEDSGTEAVADGDPRGGGGPASRQRRQGSARLAASPTSTAGRAGRWNWPT